MAWDFVSSPLPRLWRGQIFLHGHCLWYSIHHSYIWLLQSKQEGGWAGSHYLYKHLPWQSTLWHATEPDARAAAVCMFKVMPPPQALCLLSVSTGARTDRDGLHLDGLQGSLCASPWCKCSSMATENAGRIIWSSCSCSPGAIKAQQWPDFSSVIRSNGTASKIPRNFPFVAAVGSKLLYRAERIRDPAVEYFPNSTRHKW